METGLWIAGGAQQRAQTCPSRPHRTHPGPRRRTRRPHHCRQWRGHGPDHLGSRGPAAKAPWACAPCRNGPSTWAGNSPEVPAPGRHHHPHRGAQSGDPTADPIRIFIADDHTLVRTGIQALLETVDDLTVVGEASGGQQAVDLVLARRPDVVLMDLEMPVLDGIGAIRHHGPVAGENASWC
ncbi:MAG: response regulator transcription factor [Caldilineaceae bacterium]